MSDATNAVFLSYASQDAEAARRICEALRLEGIEVWFDQSALRGGEAWDASIRRQIRDCALFVPLVSIHTQERREGYFRLEWKLADERTHLMAEGTPLILPVVLDSTNERDALVPKSFLAVQWTWLPHGEVPAGLVLRVQKLLGAGDAGVSETRAANSRSSPLRKPADALSARSTATDQVGNTVGGRRQPSLRTVLPWLLALLGGGLATWLALRTGSTRTPEPAARLALPVAQAIINLPANAPLAPTRALPLALSHPSLALSPDGTKLVYVALVGQTTQLYLRPLDRMEARPIAGTEGAYHPFFSPDSEWVGFFAHDEVKKVSVLGGTPLTLCDSGNELHGGTWGDDGKIYFAPQGVLMRVADTGGAAEVVGADRGGIVTELPVLMPGAKALLGWFPDGGITAQSGDFRPIDLLSLASRKRVEVVSRGFSPHWLPTGYVVFARGSGLFAAEFNPSAGHAAGEAVPVLDGVMTNALDGTAQFAVSANGSLVYAAGGAEDRSRPVWVERDGSVHALPIEARTYGEPKLSPDGRKLVLPVAGVTDNLWIFDVATGQGAPLDEPGQNLRAVWTDDSRRLIFSSKRAVKPGIYWKAINGSETTARLLYETPPNTSAYPAALVPRENKLVLSTVSRDGWKAFTLALDGSKTLEPLAGGAEAWFVRFSPDGHWICFTAKRSGRSEVYVQRYPAGGVTQISFEGGEEALWSPQGNELFYRNRDTWLAVAVTLEPTFKAGLPRKMFSGAFLNVPGYSEDIAPDGKRFLMLMPEQPETPVTQLHLIVNWAEDVRRRVDSARPRNSKE